MLSQQTNEMPQLFSQEPINFTRHLHLQGIRRGHKVLVVGCGPEAMMIALAKLVGTNGQITVIGVDVNALATLKAAADSGVFTAVKPFSGSHPAFDLRPDSQRYQPISIDTYLLKSADLPFADGHFSSVLLSANLRKFTIGEQTHLRNELNRVTK